MTKQFLEWTEALAVDHGLIDSDHRHLIMLINRFHDSVESGANGDLVCKTLCDLADYSCFHFIREETLMSTIGYGARAAHIAEHNSFVNRLTEMTAAFEQGKLDSKVILDYLPVWIVNHVMKTDQNFGRYLADYHQQGW
ncbi:MAG: bacteriohemerythrin [Rhodospirillaceae bacterium]